MSLKTRPARGIASQEWPEETYAFAMQNRQQYDKSRRRMAVPIRDGSTLDKQYPRLLPGLDGNLWSTHFAKDKYERGFLTRMGYTTDLTAEIRWMKDVAAGDEKALAQLAKRGEKRLRVIAESVFDVTGDEVVTSLVQEAVAGLIAAKGSAIAAPARKPAVPASAAKSAPLPTIPPEPEPIDEPEAAPAVSSGGDLKKASRKRLTSMAKSLGVYDDDTMGDDVASKRANANLRAAINGAR